VCGRAYSVFVMGVRDPTFERLARRFGLEHALLAALALLLTGTALGAYVLESWVARGFGTLSEERLAIVATTLFVAGIQVFFTALLVSLIGLRRQRG
jgi:hypothetical protein